MSPAAFGLPFGSEPEWSGIVRKRIIEIFEEFSQRTEKLSLS